MRGIVSVPDIRQGRWTLEGTRLEVALIKAVMLKGWDYLQETYPHWKITRDEAETCLAWTFPPTRDQVEIDAEELSVRCLCGEWVDVAEGDRSRLVCETCGRMYTITLEIKEEIPA